MSTQLHSVNPATGEIVGAVEVTAPSDVSDIVARASAAQPGWEALGFTGRRELLRRAGERILARAAELGELLCREMGKPLRDALSEVRSCGMSDRELNEMQTAFAPQVLDAGDARSTIHRTPFGVCAAITPWNFPMSMPHWLALPALTAGNTLVLKPSEEAPLIAQAYIDILREDLPADVVHVIHGADAQGQALVTSDVDLIAFTGSRDVGKKILAAAAPRLTRVILELGGKDPMIVLPGADLERAGRFAATNSFGNAGQVCVSTERIYVLRAAVEPFIERLVEQTQRMPVGNGLHDGTRIGPMINARQRDHVLTQIDEALAQGATLVHGGTGHHELFVMPTILRGVTHQMSIAREETFGPVACIIEVDDVDEAIALANDTEFGLGATVWGPSGEATVRVARQIRAGMVGINKSCGGVAGTPWVGAKQSGYGFHSSVEGHRQFAQVQVVTEKQSN